MGGAEAAARKWSGPRRAEGRSCFVRSAEYPARPAGLGAAESGASALRVLSPGWRPRPATLGPALEALAARRLDWGVVSERGPGGEVACGARAGGCGVALWDTLKDWLILPSRPLIQTFTPRTFTGLLCAFLGVSP